MVRPDSSCCNNTRTDCGGGVDTGGNVEQYEAVQHAVVEESTTTTTRIIVPETYEVRSFTTEVESSTEMAGSGDVRDVSEPSGLVQNVDAQAVLDEIEHKRWFTSPHRVGSFTHDSSGNMFFGDGHEIIMINTTDNTKTTWTVPEGWNSLVVTADESGVYLRGSADLARLDPNTGVFTSWDGVVGGMQSIDGDLYTSGRGYMLDSPTQLNITQFYKSSDNLVIRGEKASGTVRVEVTSPSNVTKTGSTYAGENATFSVTFDDFFDSSRRIYDYESGTYVINANDIFSAVEAVFEVNNTQHRYGREPVPVHADKIFLQKFDPESSRLTLFASNLDLGRFRPYSITSDHSSNLYILDLPTRRGWGSDVYMAMNILKFSPDDNAVTYWHDVQDNNAITWVYSEGISNIAVSDDKIYWGYNAGRNTLQIAELDTETGIISEVTAPYRCTDQHKIRGMSADSSGSIFFIGCNHNSLYKFTPPDTFTKFNVGDINIPRAFSMDSSNTLYVGNYGVVHAIKLLPPDPANATITQDPLGILTYPDHGAFTNNPEIPYRINFSKHIAGFESDDINISGTADASVESLSRDRNGFILKVLAQNNGTVTVEIPECAVTDRRNVCNSPSSAHTTTVDTVPPTVSSVSLDNTGTEITITASEILVGLEIDDGYAEDFAMSDTAISSVIISENTITITLEEAMPINSTETITYVDNMDIIDLAGNYMDDFAHVVQN